MYHGCSKLGVTLQGRVKMYKAVTIIMFFYTVVSNAAGIEECKKVTRNTERLACYDNYHNYQESDSDTTESEILSTNASKVRKKKKESDSFSLQPYRQSYFMPISYNSRRQTFDQSINSSDNNTPSLDELEAKFQISFKMNLLNDVWNTNTQLVVAYTQKSFWQMYNSDLSSLFRESNYEPEIFLSKDTNIAFLGADLINVSFGLSHQSNGRSNLLSRSWNRVYANLTFQRDDLLFSFKPWKRISESVDKDDNPDIEDYLGRYEINLAYQYNKNKFTVMLRNITANKHSASYQLGWLYSLNDDVSFYIEYFNGYGESLIDYNHRSKTIGFGIAVGE